MITIRKGLIMWKPISTAIHDEHEVLIKTRIGVVSAWYDASSGEWVCYDDGFAVQETSDMMWMELPDSPEVPTKQGQ